VIDRPKTVLVAYDDPATCWMFQRYLPDHLPGFRVASVSHGQEAIDYLATLPVAVLVTGIAMPVKDGFDLLAHVQNHHPKLPVVVIAAIAPRSDAEAEPSHGTLRLLRKPVPPAELAKQVLAAHVEAANEGYAGVTLLPLLRLVQAERRSCALHLRSGDRRGDLHFVAGELVNAHVAESDLDAEAAARHLLGFDDVTIAFEALRDDHARRIHTPLATLLREIDGGPANARATGDPIASTRAPAAAPKAPTPTEPPPTAPEPPATPAVAVPPAPEATAPRAVAVPAAPEQPAAPAPPHAHAVPPRPAARPSSSPSMPRAAFQPVDRAADDLLAAVTRLRERSRSTARSLAEAGPELHAGASALAGARRDDAMHVARMSDSWRAVSALAASLARATEALGPDPEIGR
jgi:CheY-like chemotaxis protein